jgi:hypothetical protein
MDKNMSKKSNLNKKTHEIDFTKQGNTFKTLLD